MMELGNLALLCAKRNDVSFQIYQGNVTVHVGQGAERRSLSSKWNDNVNIMIIIHELNFGKFKQS